MAALEFTLSDEHMAALNKVSKIELGYPTDIMVSTGAMTIDGECSVTPAIADLV